MMLRPTVARFDAWALERLPNGQGIQEFTQIYIFTTAEKIGSSLRKPYCRKEFAKEKKLEEKIDQYPIPTV
jgi:hypothetical protein